VVVGAAVGGVAVLGAVDFAAGFAIRRRRRRSVGHQLPA
jgi:hypothetical protein